MEVVTVTSTYYPKQSLKLSHIKCHICSHTGSPVANKTNPRQASRDTDLHFGKNSNYGEKGFNSPSITSSLDQYLLLSWLLVCHSSKVIFLLHTLIRIKEMVRTFQEP